MGNEKFERVCYYCWVPVCPLEVNWLSEKISSRDLVMMRRRDDAVAEHK